ncbi:PREDICTED: vesicle-associated membrane protein 4 isoform X3 [Chinchilla lanigera]|uniref:vesicle-associated membrane protein 4 isoform X3 n=1 Tax=Chinchilla lanigera TaxID=34839 RepID=UPI00038EC945|nr:PREDICTED: vesicle-associated membrane protein 4 isoform X3 [Chinchilla lanigera]
MIRSRSSRPSTLAQPGDSSDPKHHLFTACQSVSNLGARPVKKGGQIDSFDHLRGPAPPPRLAPGRGAPIASMSGGAAPAQRPSPGARPLCPPPLRPLRLPAPSPAAHPPQAARERCGSSPEPQPLL